MSGVTATGRPRQTLPFPLRLLATALVAVIIAETAYHLARAGVLSREVPLLAHLLGAALLWYGRLRAPVAMRPLLAGFVLIGLVAGAVILTRAALLFWHNELVARVTGSYLPRSDSGFPQRPVD